MFTLGSVFSPLLLVSGGGGSQKCEKRIAVQTVCADALVLMADSLGGLKEKLMK